jgi:hypothetical protein
MDLTSLETDPVSSVDPNVLYDRLRDAASETMQALDDPRTAEDVAAAEATLATAFLQLDDWIARGGFLPAAWQGDS